MPVATIKPGTTYRKDLKTLEGAFVEIRQLSFDEMLERRDKAMKMSMEAREGKRARKDEKRKIDFESAMQWTRYFEFSRCIVDHNLTDENERPLDFSNRMTLKVLDPRVAQEIERHIEELNQEDEDEDMEDFFKQHSSSSKNENRMQNDDSENDESPKSIDGSE